jgi:phosphatidylserine/phosphatidylglycerophosphate/cardiolipin synthase-like enzyme
MAAPAAKAVVSSTALSDVMRALREANNEVDGLRTELALLREQSVARHEGGVPPRIFDATAGLESLVTAIRGAKSYVLLCAFTFDLDVVTAALISAKSRSSRLDERVLIDQGQALNGNTRNLRPKVMQLVANGVSVRLYSKRRLHAKVLLTDVGQYVGSLNWTNASQENVERVARFHLREPAAKAERDWFDALWAESKDLNGKTELPTTPVKILSGRGGRAASHDPRVVQFSE